MSKGKRGQKRLFQFCQDLLQAQGVPSNSHCLPAVKVHMERTCWRQPRRYSSWKPALAKPDEVECTDFIGLGQCKNKHGPHGRVMALLAKCVNLVTLQPDSMSRPCNINRTKEKRTRQVVTTYPPPTPKSRPKNTPGKNCPKKSNKYTDCSLERVVVRLIFQKA